MYRKITETSCLTAWSANWGPKGRNRSTVVCKPVACEKQSLNMTSISQTYLSRMISNHLEPEKTFLSQSRSSQAQQLYKDWAKKDLINHTG